MLQADAMSQGIPKYAKILILVAACAFTVSISFLFSLGDDEGPARATVQHKSMRADPQIETASTQLPSLIWMAPVLNPSGFSSEVLAYIDGLESEYRNGRGTLGLRQFAEPEAYNYADGLPHRTREAVENSMVDGRKHSEWDVAICHSTPDFWHEDGAFGWGSMEPCPPPGTKYAIGRAMYESDRLPRNWAPRIQKMDEVWVPTEFSKEQFIRSGISAEKIVVVPEAVDTEFFKPRPREIPVGGVFRFLSVFKWEPRKGWHALLQAFFEEFSRNDNVELILKTQAFHSLDDFSDKVREFAHSMKDAARKPLARVKILKKDISFQSLPRLYSKADALVAPSRGEGWGRPQVEAMAMGLPIIATNWSGPTAFINERVALPLRFDGLSPLPGDNEKEHLYANPSVSHLRQLMRWLAENRMEARQLGKRAREEMVSRFSTSVIVQNHIIPRLKSIRKRLAD